jgi:hypothetical protein
VNTEPRLLPAAKVKAIRHDVERVMEDDADWRGYAIKLRDHVVALLRDRKARTIALQAATRPYSGQRGMSADDLQRLADEVVLQPHRDFDFKVER